MTEENQEYTSSNAEDAIRQENEDKQPASTTITVRVPYSVKARLYDLSEQGKMTLNAFVATRLYKYIQGQIGERQELQEQVEQLSRDLQEANRKVETWEQAYEELKKEKTELDKRPAKKQLDEVNQEKDRLAKQVSDLQKQLEKAQSDKSKTADDKDKRIKQLEKELDQYKGDIKNKESERKSEAAKRQNLEQTMTEMQYYINRHAAGLFQKPHQFVNGVPIDPDEE
jgi:DNA repair exonuclease SbcCD ATPase subunit